MEISVATESSSDCSNDARNDDTKLIKVSNEMIYLMIYSSFGFFTSAIR